MPNVVVQAFLDVEFTSFERPEALSAGMCTADGRECYVELDVHGPSGKVAAARSNTFVRDTVLPQFGLMPHQAADRKAMGRHLASWLIGLDAQRVDLVYDYAADWLLFERLLRTAGMWSHVEPMLCQVDLSLVIGTPESDAASNGSWAESEKQGLARHHALADARALRTVALDTAAGRAELARLKVDVNACRP